MHKNITAIFLLIWIVLFWIITAINPLDRYDWLMENILFIVSFTILVVTYKSFKFSNLSYVLIVLFFTLHLMGAHYTYSKVPFGFYLSEIFALERNHFDRIVHFSFGLLIAYPLQEILYRKLNLKGFAANYLMLNIILASSGFFEIIESLFVLMVKPELGEAYLGTQGDSWDAQKDMVLALVGAIVAILISKMIRPISKA